MDSQTQPPQGPLPSSHSSQAKVIATGDAARRPQGARAFPKPPNFFRWMLLLCLKPQAWAQAARYPTYVTLIPLAVMIVVGGLLAIGVPAVREYRALQNFAASYDQKYPALELTNDATLQVAGGAELKTPIRLPAVNEIILIDPTGATHPQTVSWGHTYALVTDKNLYTRRDTSLLRDNEEPYTQQALSDFNSFATMGLLPIPEKGKVTTINGTAISAYLQKNLPMLSLMAALSGLLVALGDVIWAAIMIFIMSSVVMQVASITAVREGRRTRPLILPRRAAVRMVAALLVPLVLISSILKACSASVTDLLGAYVSPAFWIAAALGLTIWTGVMARRMYAARPA